jgi:hypothetical protein
MRAYEVDIYEQQDSEQKLILSHIFYGDTMSEVEGYIKAHSKYDSFFAAARTTKVFKGIPLIVEEYWL